MGCPDLTTDLSADEALAILEPYFFAIRDRFVEAGLVAVRDTRLRSSAEMHDTVRHFAGCQDDGKLIVVAPELSELPEDFVIGILGHELGHATDFCYPGEFALSEEGIIRRKQDDIDERQWLRWQREWDKRSADVVEQTADRIASGVWGKPIGYAGPCLLQTFRTGVPRPRGLR